jgi:ribosome maturation factor RimP
VQDLQGKIERTENVDELQKLSTALSELLDSLDKVRRLKKS